MPTVANLYRTLVIFLVRLVSGASAPMPEGHRQGAYVERLAKA